MHTQEKVDFETFLHKLISEFMLYQGYFPQEMLAQMLKDKEQSIPFLHHMLDATIQNYEAITSSHVGHVYALYMLAELRDNTAFPLACQLLSLFDDASSDIILSRALGDMPKILTSLYDGNPQAIYRLIENPTLSLTARNVGIETLASLYFSNQLGEHELVRYFLYALHTIKEEFLQLSLLFAVQDIRLEELYDSVRSLLQNGSIDEGLWLLEKFEEGIQLPLQPSSPLFIDNAIETIEALGLFDDEVDFITEEFQEVWGDTLFEILYKSDRLPVDAIKSLLKRRERASDLLQHILSVATTKYPDIPDDVVGHIYALIVLAHMRQTDAFEQVLELFSNAHDADENLLIDLIESRGNAILASLYNGQRELLHHFIASQDVALIPRAEAIHTFSTLFRLQKISRSELVGHFERLIEELEGQEEGVLLAALAMEIANLRLDALFERVRTCYRNGRLAEEILPFTLFEELVVAGTPYLAEYPLIDDVYEELKSINSLTYKLGPVSVGRNDPCPCGSGKKYKKCCL